MIHVSSSCYNAAELHQLIRYQLHQQIIISVSLSTCLWVGVPGAAINNIQAVLWSVDTFGYESDILIKCWNNPSIGYNGFILSRNDISDPCSLLPYCQRWLTLRNESPWINLWLYHYLRSCLNTVVYIQCAYWRRWSILRGSFLHLQLYHSLFIEQDTSQWVAFFGKTLICYHMI